LIRVGLIKVDLIIKQEFHIDDVPFGSKSRLVTPKLLLVRCNCLELVLKEFYGRDQEVERREDVIEVLVI
jgi:hypothetical protein